MDRSSRTHGGHDLHALADTLVGTFPGACDARLAVALVRELACGEPVANQRIAAITGLDEREVTATLIGWPNVQRDERDRVVAFGGLTLRPTAHRFEVGGRGLYTWCAWDTLFLPAIVGERATVHSRCRFSGKPVHFTVDRERVGPTGADAISVSFPTPETTSCEDIAGTFCCHVHFLDGPEAAERWRDTQNRVIVLSLAEAFELGRLATRACLTGA